MKSERKKIKKLDNGIELTKYMPILENPNEQKWKKEINAQSKCLNAYDQMFWIKKQKHFSPSIDFFVSICKRQPHTQKLKWWHLRRIPFVMVKINPKVFAQIPASMPENRVVQSNSILSLNKKI